MKKILMILGFVVLGLIVGCEKDITKDENPVIENSKVTPLGEAVYFYHLKCTACGYEKDCDCGEGTCEAFCPGCVRTLTKADWEKRSCAPVK